MKIGICSDIHGHADRLRQVLDQMKDAAADERWWLGDLIGGGPDPLGVARLARQFDMCLLGNHDAWMLAGMAWPETAWQLRGRDAFWLSSLSPLGERYGVKCWHGAPSKPLVGFFDATAALSELFALTPGSTSLVGHTHVPAAFIHSGPTSFK